MDYDAVAAAIVAHRRRRKSEDVKPTEVFHGQRAKDRQTALDFIDDLDHDAAAGGWTPDQKIRVFCASLRGVALEWWISLDWTEVDKTAWDQICCDFLKTFDYWPRASLRDLTMRTDEDVTQFQFRVYRTFRRLIATRPAMTTVAEVHQFMMTQTFIEGLSPEIRAKVWDAPRATLGEIAKAARDAEVILACTKR
jgi:hypothetical protein